MSAGALDHQEKSAGIQENSPGQLGGAQDQVHRGPALCDDGPLGVPQLLRLRSTAALFCRVNIESVQSEN